MGLGEEGPDAELGDQLRDALDERLKGGDVPHVVRSLLRPVWLPSEEVMLSDFQFHQGWTKSTEDGLLKAPRTLRVYRGRLRTDNPPGNNF